MNKKTILAFLLALLTMSATAQVKVEVSETVELMAILSRTAGFEEFSGNYAGQYSKDTEAWFASYKNHPTVAYYQDIRAKQNIAYERVTNMAVHLDIEKGKLKLIGDRKELTNGWQNVDLDDFVKRLNKFYTDTRFHEFFEQHQAFYDEYLKAYEANVAVNIHPEWYSHFYNGTEPTEQFRIIIGFSYGSTNNGVSRQLPGQPRELFAVCGYRLNPTTGTPYYDASLPIHEFSHPYVNPLLDNATNAATMQAPGQKLLQLAQSAMETQHYPEWQIVINESIVRVAVVLYMHEQGFQQQMVLNVLAFQMMNEGFPWTLDVVSALNYYAAHRDQYKTLNDFYPEIARSLDKYIDGKQKTQ
ncbi:MAG: DUF4932 domain-containing protein [Bacteroidaceae bacterium]|nr:DUF4932 domain-containing protein [Bacteroidaceae bacterium]